MQGIKVALSDILSGLEDTDFEDKFMFVVHDPMLIDGFLCDRYILCGIIKKAQLPFRQ